MVVVTVTTRHSVILLLLLRFWLPEIHNFAFVLKWPIAGYFIGRPDPKCEPMKYLKSLLTKIYLLGQLVLILHSRIRKRNFRALNVFCLIFLTPLDIWSDPSIIWLALIFQCFKDNDYCVQRTKRDDGLTRWLMSLSGPTKNTAVCEIYTELILTIEWDFYNIGNY